MEATNKLLTEALLGMGLDTQEYSGRGMYGKKCLGVVVPNGSSLIGLGLHILNSARTSLGDEDCVIDDFIADIEDAKTDNMGRDTIVYWENLDYIDLDDTDDCDEEE
jgi:hypothetical protein